MRRFFRNYYREHMDKTKRRVEAGEGGGLGWGWVGRRGEKMQTTVNEQ